ncbi:MAG: hypothetical protein GX383_08760 [Clostridium sp.]|jgi:hypothetical protein|nr:hypothetical protein [Clostridium sp.]
MIISGEIKKVTVVEYIENEAIRKENDELKTKLKEIGGSLITEYQTSEGIGEEDNNRIQEMAIAFIKAQYRGDIEAIKQMCTDEFRKKVEHNPAQYLLDDKGNVVFTQIRNVAKEGDLYLVYVRLSDDSDISSYQINFEIVKENDEFLVNFAGYDA